MQSARWILPARRCNPISQSSFVGRPHQRQKSHLANRLSPSEIDAKWQQRWQEAALLQTPSRKLKSYVLPMFAYPSGSLHLGHLRVYTISDVLARYRHMQGYNVLHPTGWDAFGLPAENAALERGIDPAVWTEDNIGKMKAQLKSMNTSFDWDREFKTCDPAFYKHTQKIFLLLHKRGMAYQAEALVNYDPVDKTVLANEQVDSQGRSWRSGAVVEKRNLKQWFFRITAFKEALLEDLNILSQDQRWPERVITQQRNWLGKSEGAKVKFDVKIADTGRTEAVEVFTTRPDTLFGAQYLALSISHPLVVEIASRHSEVQAFINTQASFSVDNKVGMRLPGIVALNPARLLTKAGNHCSEPLPIFVAPYVLEGYGEGAVMGVPAHDSRDFDFWKQQSPTATARVVVSANEADADPDSSMNLQPHISDLSQAYTSRGVLTRLNGEYAGMSSDAASELLIHDLHIKDKAELVQNWRLRDWLVSRQRYWGTPIPIVHCDKCRAVPVPDEDLPVELPKLDESLRGMRGNPLEKIDSWVNTSCPNCHGPAKRDTDTMDTFVDSSWYFMRFPDAHNTLEPFSSKSADSMVPVDTYVGGVEHAILHLLYARFIYKFLASEGLIHKGDAHQEPFTQLIAQGMVHGKTFSDPGTGRFLLPTEIEEAGDGTALIKLTGTAPIVSWEKMSKSKYNGVDPKICIDRFGADTVRAHMLFAAPVSETLQWDDQKIVGIERWFHRLNRLISAYQQINSKEIYQPAHKQLAKTLNSTDAPIFLLTQETIKMVTRTLGADIYSLNTAVSDLIKLTNALTDIKLQNLSPWVAYHSISSLLRLLAPIGPAFAEECWEGLHLGIQGVKNLSVSGNNNSIFDSPWPSYDLTALLEEQIMAMNIESSTVCAVQVNGKLRFTINVTTGTGQKKKDIEDALLIEAILDSEEGKHWLKEKHVWEKRKRVVIVGGGKLVNIVF